MEINIQLKTRFEVGDIVYYIAGRNIVKSKISAIQFFGYVSRLKNVSYLYIMENDVHVHEKSIYKTEYEAKIALGNMF